MSLDYDVGKGVEVMRLICGAWDVGYSQGADRWDIRQGGSADCSSAVAWAVNSGYRQVLLDHATYTGNLRERLHALGWQVLPGMTSPRVGDVLLREGSHTGMVVAPGVVAEAWINESGRIVGGRSGDQSGQETREIAYLSHPMTRARQWTHLLRPPATTITRTIDHEEDEMNTEQAKQLATIHARSKTISDALTAGRGDVDMVRRVDSRVRDVKDLLTGGTGRDLLQEILDGQAQILARLDRLEQEATK